jgi:hypothetical protein
MEKEIIKNILRETFLVQIQEVKRKPKRKKSAKLKKKFEADYQFVQDKLVGSILKQSQVMKAAGLGDPENATDRSLFSKKVRRFKNDEGSRYQFNRKELAKIVKILNNPLPYM